ncbi:hypothetical protein [Nocardia niwae]|uniref:hypothetical protein n=1 Tax=Nocardia niwae TaxID=626084 RepID=UPI0033C8B611
MHLPTTSLVERSRSVAAAAMRARTPISADPKAQAIELMLSMWTNLAMLKASWKLGALPL